MNTCTSQCQTVGLNLVEFERRQSIQLARGGNRHVGNRLSSLLEAHGFTDVMSDVYHLSEELMPWQKLCDTLVAVFKASKQLCYEDGERDPVILEAADRAAKWFREGEAKHHSIRCPVVMASGT